MILEIDKKKKKKKKKKDNGDFLFNNSHYK